MDVLESKADVVAELFAVLRHQQLFYSATHSQSKVIMPPMIWAFALEETKYIVATLDQLVFVNTLTQFISCFQDTLIGWQFMNFILPNLPALPDSDMHLQNSLVKEKKTNKNSVQKIDSIAHDLVVTFLICYTNLWFSGVSFSNNLICSQCS